MAETRKKYILACVDEYLEHRLTKFYSPVEAGQGTVQLIQ